MCNTSEENKSIDYKWFTFPQMRNALIAGGLIGFALILSKIGIIPNYSTNVIYVIAAIIGGYYWIREGIEELIHCREVGIELLMLSAAIGSGALGLWEEAALLVFIYSAAEGLEGYTFAKTRASIRKLLDLAPKEARVVKHGQEVLIPATELKMGDIFIIRPGQSMPTDGVIIDGDSCVNEAPVTGESLPVEKKKGMKVYAATINQEGVLKVKVTATFANNTLSKMVHMVEEAQEKKGKSQVFIEKFGNRYSPLVLIFGLALMLIPPLFGLPISFWAERAIVFLVAAAPCALVMSTPVAVSAGIGIAGKNGVLIKGGKHLENLGKIQVVAFDKTGTLTLGRPVVTDIKALDGNDGKILELAASVEQHSEHPLAKAVVAKATELNMKLHDVYGFKALTGAGAVAKVGDRMILVGKEELFENINQELHSKSEALLKEGKTVFYIGTNKKMLGAIAIRDEIRPNAAEVIQKLHSMDVKVVMLTGDNEITANAISKEIGIDDVRAGLKPKDKLVVINELKKEFQGVAMVGDGINDTPALAAAPVGIAMGTVGTDAAIEAADVALMGDDITKIAYAVELGRRSKTISQQNIIFSLLLLAVLIPSALIGILTITVAVVVHEVGELLAIGNGLRVAKNI
ncbi:cation-translocating P-type ATPase [Patescibacteria group bacterium]|nr:cation-translocating P-type ATPase [Patescibacteria group bacterium]